MLGSYILGLSMIVNFLVGAIVAYQGLKNRQTRIFIAVVAVFTSIGVANTLSLETSLDQFFFIKAVMVSTTLAVYLLYLLVISIQPQPIFKKTTTIFLSIFTALVAILDVTPLIFSDYQAGNPPVPVPAIAFPIFLIHFIYTVLLTVHVLLAGRKTASRKQKGQYRLIFLGLVPILFFAPLTSIALPQVFGISSFIVLSPIYTTFFLLCVGYAIVRHGLFDVKQTVVRTMAYTLSLIVLAATYYLLAYIVSVTLFQGEVNSSVSISPVNIALALLLAFIFQPIKNFFDRITDKIFYRDRYDSNDFIARLSEVLTTTTDLRGLLQRASSEIGSTFKAEQAFFFVQYNHVHHLSAGTKHYTSLPVKDARRLNAYVEEEGDSIVVTDLLPDDHEIYRLLISHKVAMLMPLMRGRKVLGYLALGESRGGGYTNRDIKVLSTIADELLIAIQHALSVQEVKDINANLQQRIDAATHELRATNTQLRHIDTTKDEFLSMASHQLRTPLTSVKGYISMVLEGDAGKISDAQRHLLGEAFTSSERMVHLIHDFLNVSRLQTGKFALEQHPYNLVKLIEEEVASLQRTAEARQMTLQFNTTADLPRLNIDENKIRQVVMNFIDNAMFYSHQHTTITIDLSEKSGQVELRVNDTGIGVPKSEQARLFSKFYRASNARKQRPDGTGVGLFLAKKVIMAHGGEMLFESVENKGSTFGFHLPIEKLAVISEKETTKPVPARKSAK